ncbi:MAG: hypothetical protein WD512_05325, partial [Candidatus Paceibacterota bacterium]
MKKLFKLPYWIDKKLTEKFSMLSMSMKISLCDENGKVIKSHKQIAHSVNANFLGRIYTAGINGAVPGAYGFTAPFITNNAVLLLGAGGWATSSADNSFPGLINSAASGIVIGTGAPVVAPFTTNLTAIIPHGTGAGQMVYQTQLSANGVTVAGMVSSFIIVRNFLNSSGFPIDITEAAIYANPVS